MKNLEYIESRSLASLMASHSDEKDYKIKVLLTLKNTKIPLKEYHSTRNDTPEAYQMSAHRFIETLS